MWLFFLLLASASSTNLYPKGVSKIQDEPLFLTPYIENGNIEEARRLSLVTDLSPNITSYTGFITIDKECGSNMFFWFFPSQNDWLNDPVTVWLNGGPGASSLYGLFEENSPYTLTLDGELVLNPYSWNQNSSLIFIDNPVGTGFSFTENGCYVNDEDQLGQAILKMLIQFFQLFPELKTNPFFLAGESYAGKYVPAIAHAIHNSHPKEIDLQGVAIGDGWVDPINQMVLADYLYQLGLVDDNTRDEIHAVEVKITDLIQAANYSAAYDLFNEKVLGIFSNASNFDNYYHNYLWTREEPEPDIHGFVERDDVKRAIHVGNITLNLNGGEDHTAYLHLYADFMQSVRPWLEELLDNDYRVILYNGQLDIICAYPLTVNFVKKLNWSGAEEYKTAKRHVWYVGEDVAGYAKTVRNFSEILVRNAGHMVPKYQPKWALDLYNRFIFNQPFSSLINIR